MKHKAERSNPEYDRFADVLRKVVTTPKSVVKAKIEADKQKRKRESSGRAASDVN